LVHPVEFDPDRIAGNLHDIASVGFGGRESADETQSVFHPKVIIPTGFPPLTTVARKIRIADRLAGFGDDLARRKLEQESDVGGSAKLPRITALPRRNELGADFPRAISGFSLSAAVELSRYRESSRRHAGP